MRYLILLVVFTPLLSQGAYTQTIPGQLCTTNDLKNADPGCCASTSYECSDLIVSGQSTANKRTCCHQRNPQNWDTDPLTLNRPTPTCVLSGSSCDTFPKNCVVDDNNKNIKNKPK